MVGPAFYEFVLEGQLRVVAEFVVVLLLGVATDDVVGFLLSFKDLEALETKSALGWEVDTAHVVFHSTEVGGNSDTISCFTNRW